MKVSFSVWCRIEGAESPMTSGLGSRYKERFDALSFANLDCGEINTKPCLWCKEEVMFNNKPANPKDPKDYATIEDSHKSLKEKLTDLKWGMIAKRQLEEFLRGIEELLKERTE